MQTVTYHIIKITVYILIRGRKFSCLFDLRSCVTSNARINIGNNIKKTTTDFECINLLQTPLGLLAGMAGSKISDKISSQRN